MEYESIEKKAEESANTIDEVISLIEYIEKI
jgi:hypothetical protein